jgi:hypothetical protein
MINDAAAWLMALKEWPQEARDILLASLNNYIASFLKSYLGRVLANSESLLALIFYQLSLFVEGVFLFCA